MKYTFSAVLLAFIMALTARPAAAEPKMADYTSTPFWLEGRSIPNVMLVLERDWKMFYPAYNNLNDLDGDGALDIGFNPKVTYVGYFDSDSCYQYDLNGFSPSASNDEKGLFVRVRAATPQTQGEADSLAVSRGIAASNLNYPASKHGVCGGGGRRSSGLGLWHGNWLNFAMTSRMDAIRKVLYGGKRTTDTVSRTILEMVRVPANANVWGGELYADDIWESYAPSSPWYPIENFTGFEAPKSGAMHFWARGDHFWRTPVYTVANPTPQRTEVNQKDIQKNSVPLFRFVTNVPGTNRHPFLKTPLRIWDWIGDHASHNSIPSDGHLANSRNPKGEIQNDFMAGRKNVAWNFAARVEVCRPGNMSPTEGCQAYQGNYKPVGLLQKYGEKSQMFFGLLTGTVSHPTPYDLDSGTRYKGGVVRHHIQKFSNYVNSDGTIVRPGLIDTIDVFEITGIGSARAYTDGSQAGNPLGEMVWEAVRYLGGSGLGLNRTPDYTPSQAEATVLGVDNNDFTLPRVENWNPRPELGDRVNECPKPIILAISEVYPDHDGDDYPNLTDFSDLLRSSFANQSESKVPAQAFSREQYLEIITKQDELSTTDSGGKLFFYPDPNDRGLCSARKLAGLEKITGHCPSEPNLEGTYSLAAVAYYAHTHDFKLKVGKNEDGGDRTREANIDFYAVGIAGNFPDITLTIDGGRSLTLMPIALTTPIGASNTQTEGPSDGAFRTLLNFFIEYWQTDDGPSDTAADGTERILKVPYKMKFRTNFEFTTYPCFVKGGNSNNWERDLFTATTISLLTGQSTDRRLREDEPQYINSGPFKTLNRDLYVNQRAAYRSAAKLDPNVNADSYFKQTGGQKYYYAFKKTKGVHLDISKQTVVGVSVHSDSTGSGYGASGLAGYTITGVRRPGAYLDVGLNRSDYPIYYSNARCQPSFAVFAPNLACNDEDVPLDPAGSGLPGVQWDYPGRGTHATATAPFYRHLSPVEGGKYRVYTNNTDCGYYHPPTMWDPLLTPAECPYTGYSDSDSWGAEPELSAAYNPRPKAADVCGRWAAGYSGSGARRTYPTDNRQEGDLFKTSLTRYVQVRSFKFDSSADRPKNLPNPMWLAAKYGGFKDENNNGLPDLDSEWKRQGHGVGADDPFNYFRVANMSELPAQLDLAFEAIAKSVGAGTASAASINTVLGGGLSIQTQYRAEYEDPRDSAVKLKWAGSVYAFFVDKWGNLRADTNGNQKLDLATSPPPDMKSPTDPSKSLWDERYPAQTWEEKGDLIIHTVPVEGLNMPRVYLCRDVYGDNNGNTVLPDNESPNYPDPEISYPVLSACVPAFDHVGRAVGQENIEVGFEELGTVWNFAERLVAMGPDARRIYTYYGDKAAGGSAGWQGADGQLGLDLGKFPFKIADDSAEPLPALHKLMGQATEAATSDLIQYMRGHEFPQYRGRTATPPWAPTGPARTWMLGDVINSKPIIVGDATANFHLMYGSPSYAAFKSSASVARRRQVAYFGSNSGMLHAVNLGFFGGLDDGRAGYEPHPKAGGPTEWGGYKNLVPGDELWAYVPTAVLPHLGWLADPAYDHNFYVDLKPYITDITNTKGEWRTILVMGLRFGGRTIEMVNADTRPDYSYSEFFALDVTEPDAGPPKLLWRFSHPYLGLSTATPTIVRSSGEPGKDEWYAVLPSGPTSDVDSPDGSRRIPAGKNETTAYEGRSTQNARVFIINARTGQLTREPYEGDPHPLIVPEPYSFFNDAFTPRAVHITTTPPGTEPGTKPGEKLWSHHVIYMGLTATAADARGNQIDTGAMYRLQMAKADGSPLPVRHWRLGRMYKTNKPVTGAANAAYDRLNNLWVVFGTGRTWSRDDLAPCGLDSATVDKDCCENHDQYLFGLKEPLTDKGYMTFEEITDDSGIVDVSGVKVFADGKISTLPGGLSFDTYDNLYQALITKINPKRGYKRKLESWRMLDEPENEREWAKFEVITTQPKIDGLANGRSNIVVTTYETSADFCDPAGRSFLWVVDTYTGLPAPYMVSYSGFEGGRTKSEGDLASQIPGLKTAGAGVASEAWIIKSGGQTVYGNTSFNAARNKVYLPLDQSETSALVSWREVLDMGFDLKEGDEGLFQDLKD